MSQSLALEIGHLQLVADVIVWPQVLLAAQLLVSLGAPVLELCGGHSCPAGVHRGSPVCHPSCIMSTAVGKNKLASFYLCPGELRVVIKLIVF